ncbi:MAG: hypothetical protein JWM85_2847 [Acidimicrobiaceae bacterium]|nr:hypothetical protein [Acidimicrobiaceae bacterium]
MNTQHPAARRYGNVALRLLPVGVIAGGLAASIASSGTAQASTHDSTAKVSNSLTVVMAAKRGALGTILVTTGGATLYTYGKDTKNHSNVTGKVLAAWPALTVPAGKTPAGHGITGLGEFKRSNGQEQVTYRGEPLYRFIEDKKVGQATGQGINHFAVVKIGASTSTASKSPTTTAASNGIPQNNGGDGDSDNNGGPSDGDGNL